MGLLSGLLEWDKKLFFVINNGSANAVFDAILPYSRISIIWVPFYLFILVFILMNYKSRSLPWILLIILTVASSDIISSSIVKEYIFRLRPCRDPALFDQVRVLARYCPQSSSFTSSHATNHFAVSMFIYMTLKKDIGKWLRLIFLWAFIIIYAQVYVGVHYPVDVVCGALLGLGIGYMWSFIFKRNYSLHSPITTSTQ
jgi:membrane-associated phospholipid phosphatase